MECILNDSTIDEFGQWLREKEKSEATVAKYVHNVRDLSRYLAGAPVTKMALIDYRARQREQYKAKTVNGRVSAINAYLTFMGKGELKVKLFRIQHQLFAESQKELTKAEYKRLVLAAGKKKNKRLYYIIQTLGATGIRVSELAYITVDAVEAGMADISMKGKERTILISKKLKQLLTTWIKQEAIQSGPVFVTRNGRPVNRSNICHEMKKLCHAAEVDPVKVFPHNLRHLFVRCFYSINKDIGRLADILGHSCIETTRIYISVSSHQFEKIFSDMNMVILC